MRISDWSSDVCSSDLTAMTAIVESGGLPAAVAVDLGTLGVAEEAATHAAEPFGAPDNLVNAAGVNIRHPVAAVTPESWAQTLAPELRTPHFQAQPLVPSRRDVIGGDVTREGWVRERELQ